MLLFSASDPELIMIFGSTRSCANVQSCADDIVESADLSGSSSEVSFYLRRSPKGTAMSRNQQIGHYCWSVQSGWRIIYHSDMTGAAGSFLDRNCPQLNMFTVRLLYEKLLVTIGAKK
jgi:hypothetical protein